MVALTREEFFGDPAVSAGLDDFAEACLDALEQGSEFPDPIGFLRGRGIEQFPDGDIEVHHTVGVEPLRPLCPDGSDGCYPRCRIVKGQQQCVWVCRCP